MLVYLYKCIESDGVIVNKAPIPITDSQKGPMRGRKDLYFRNLLVARKQYQHTFISIQITYIYQQQRLTHIPCLVKNQDSLMKGIQE